QINTDLYKPLLYEFIYYFDEKSIPLCSPLLLGEGLGGEVLFSSFFNYNFITIFEVKPILNAA
ncbi:MAG: hypothetical protein UZ05_CHB002000668, partial [Chlorobi bacterium OLB5]